MLAISPDATTEIKATLNKHQLTFELFSDPDLSLIRDMGIVFQKPGRKPLPVPAVYIIGADGTIRLQHVDPNFRVRLDSLVVLAMVKTLP